MNYFDDDDNQELPNVSNPKVPVESKKQEVPINSAKNIGQDGLGTSRNLGNFFQQKGIPQANNNQIPFLKKEKSEVKTPIIPPMQNKIEANKPINIPQAQNKSSFFLAPNKTSIIQEKPKDNPLIFNTSINENKPKDAKKEISLPNANHIIQNSEFIIKSDKPVPRINQMNNQKVNENEGIKDVPSPQILKKDSNKIFSPEPQNMIPNKPKSEKFKSNISSISKLSKMLMSDSLPNKVQESESLSALSKNSAIIKTFPELFCGSCKNFSFMFNLDCSHSACLTCLKTTLNNLATSPTPSNFSQSRCQVCFLFPSYDNIHRIMNSESLAQKITSLNIPKECLWCKRSLNLLTGYFPELECLHLCRECYTADLYYGCKKCICCAAPFKNSEITLQRMEKCVRCNALGKTVIKGYRVLHLNHALCYDCIKFSINGVSITCVYCQTSVTDKDKAAFLNFYNRICTGCDDTFCVADINICKKCSSSFCENCYMASGENNHMCCDGIS